MIIPTFLLALATGFNVPADVLDRPALVAVPTVAADASPIGLRRELERELGPGAVIHAVQVVPVIRGGSGHWVQIWTNRAFVHDVATWAQNKFHYPPQLIYHVLQAPGPFGTPFAEDQRILARVGPASAGELARLGQRLKSLDRVHAAIGDADVARAFARDFRDVLRSFYDRDVLCTVLLDHPPRP